MRKVFIVSLLILGLGLWEIRQILKKHNNLNLYTSKDEKFFKQQLEIYL